MIFGFVLYCLVLSVCLFAFCMLQYGGLKMAPIGSGTIGRYSLVEVGVLLEELCHGVSFEVSNAQARPTDTSSSCVF